jgi:hypothetical protein
MSSNEADEHKANKTLSLPNLANLPSDIADRYQALLDHIVKAADFMRNDPGYQGLQYLKNCISEIENVLNHLAESPSSSKAEEPDSTLHGKLTLEIPSSPLVTALHFHSQGHSTSLRLYTSLLNLSAPTNEDLKQTRTALADVESHDIEINRLKKRIQIVDSCVWHQWTVDQLANGIYYLSSSLFSCIASELSRFDGKLLYKSNTFRFLCYQEYLHSICLSYLRSKLLHIQHTTFKDKVKEKVRELKKKEVGSFWNVLIKLEWFIELAHTLVFRLHDISSASTVLSVIDTCLYDQSNSTYVSKSVIEWILENESYLKLQRLFGDHSISIEEELVSDMLEHGEMGIIPSVQVIVDHLVQNKNQNDYVQNALNQWRQITPVKAVKDDDVLHFILTRVYSEDAGTSWWKRYSVCGHVELDPVSEKEVEKVLEEVLKEPEEKIGSESEKDSNPDLASTSNEIADDLMKRFMSLSNKSK